MYRNALVVLKAAKPRSIPPRIAEVAAVITTVPRVAVVVSDIVEGQAVSTASSAAVVVSDDIVTIKGQARDDASGSRIIAGRRRGATRG